MQWKIHHICIVLIIISTVLLVGIMCAVPPVSRDALTHHLAVPKLYMAEGKISELPEIIPSYFPQLLDLFYCIPMYFDQDILPKYIHFFFAILTAFIIYFYLKKRLSRTYGLIGSMVFMSLPVILRLSTTVYVDLGLIFFSFAAMMAMFEWIKNPDSIRWFILSGLFTGFAMSTKYNGLITLLLMTSFISTLYIWQNYYIKKVRLKAITYGAAFVLTACMVFSPWMIKNFVWTGNPVFPMYNHIFNPKDTSETVRSYSEPAMNHFLVRKFIYKEKWWETALIPVRIFFQGKDDNPKLFDGKLNPMLFFLPILTIIDRRKKSVSPLYFEIKILAWFSFLYIMFAFLLMDMRIRYVGPAIPCLVVLSIFGIKQLIETKKRGISKKIIKGTGFLAIFFMMALNFQYLFQLFHRIDPLPYIKNEITRSEYIQKYRPEYAAIEYVNTTLNASTRLLAFFLGNRRYYFNHDVFFEKVVFEDAIKISNYPEDISILMRRKGFTHIIINVPKFNFWVNTAFDESGRKKIQEFSKSSLKLLFFKGQHGVYQIL